MLPKPSSGRASIAASLDKSDVFSAGPKFEVISEDDGEEELDDIGEEGTHVMDLRDYPRTPDVAVF